MYYNITYIKITKEIRMEKQIKIFSSNIEEGAIAQFNEAMSLPCNIAGALMPDAHQGYTLPIGAVIKSKGIVFPSYVGYDIGCGMCAINLKVNVEELNLEALRDFIVQYIPLGTTKHSTSKSIQLDINQYPNVSDFLKCRIEDTGVYQIGTLGGGNHFIEIGLSNTPSNIWIVIHSGSRGLGYKIADYYMSIATQNSVNISELEIEFLKGKEVFKEVNPDGYKKAFKKFVEKKWEVAIKNKEGHYGFDINSEIGQSYLADMNYCLDFALENRKTMIEIVIKGMEEQLDKGIERGIFINRNHNHAEVQGEFIIHRKGATHAEKGMYGIIPANMKDGSFIVKGKGNDLSLNSSSHGAGRVLSRKQALEILDVNEFHLTMQGVITNHTDATLDESPKAYKDIYEVMDLQKDLVEVIDKTYPILNIKG